MAEAPAAKSKPPRGKSIRMSDAQLRAAVRKAAQRFHAYKGPKKPLVLTGLMGVGKTAVGKRLASVLKVKFLDSDHEIERAAGLKVSEIFEKFGEPYFRDRERAIILRLLEENSGVISIGGGAFVDEETRGVILEKGMGVWLRASLDVLVERTSRRDTRPLLKTGDPREILSNLLEARTPAYNQAPVHANSGLGRLDRTVLSVLNRANRHLYGTSEPKRSRNRRRRSKKTN